MCLIFQKLLRQISRLEFLTVHHRPTLDWSDNPIRPPLFHPLHLSTLTHFSVDNINDFVVLMIKISNILLHSNLGHMECPSLADILPSMQTLNTLSWISMLMISMSISCSMFLRSSTCALKISSKLLPSESCFRQMQIAAEEMNGVGLTKYSQLWGGFCWPVILVGVTTSWMCHCKVYLRRNFSDFH